MQYGTCFAVGDSVTETNLILTIPSLLSSLAALLLNVYVAVKVYHIHRNIQNENSGSAANETLRHKRARIKKYMKPIIVIISGGILVTLSVSLLYLIETTVITSPVYHDVMSLIVYPNTFYAVPLLHPIVYGLYFEQIRQPILQKLKTLLQINTAAVAPQIPRTAWM